MPETKQVRILEVKDYLSDKKGDSQVRELARGAACAAARVLLLWPEGDEADALPPPCRRASRRGGGR